MRGVVFHGPGDVRTEDLVLPEVGPTDVVLAVEACGVCGSDLSSYAHGHYVAPGQVMGHEMSAVVVERGAALTGLEAGQRVAVRPMRSCDDCAYCRAGDTHLCGSTAGRSLGYGAQGGFAQRLHLPDVEVGRDVVPVPGGVDPFDLLWAEPLAVALHAVDLAGGDRITRLLITGAGAVGLSVAAAAVARGVAVDVVEPVADRRRAAASLGANAWAPGELPDEPVFDALIDASGAPVAVEAALDLLRPTAPVVLVGLSDAAVPWPLGGHRLTGAFGYRDGDFARAVELIADGRVSLAALVTHRYGLDQAARALTTPRPEDHVVKAAIVPDPGP
ncbi:zinc-dependent alcohol dehydrogenase [Nocardioides sp. J54]|uniref:zinc-dependent alcohol dehydrogenase n=1 Tax=Nocardioides sp. J54 TaxID=935866 RepID=UPI00048F9995|nr:alcohol dehydrogenase catalytic domain-containing protein [Nocardioides sp. J54]